MSFQDVVALLQAFADANGMKMPPQEVLDVIQEQGEKVLAEQVRARMVALYDPCEDDSGRALKGSRTAQAQML